ncbi:hypothetical protein DBR11_25440 [Pedobacter sp. HMWF019]|uniref:hypothetical protein n=1 Tax=Pedobacter sp. HMWF019 TaxID=2056856 RepID=UPI000D34F559|nr:hypothetical protein [Pedobacter sp. HMWF019]PTS93389.1 hypothetical protein DBR11_25440 [Pedobacter sp. HMWF019]
MKILKILMIVSIAMVACSKSDDKFGSQFKKLIKSHSDLTKKTAKGYSTFRLSSITDFKWEKFYVFDEFLTDKNISDIIGIEWSGRTVPSGNKRLLFINKGEVTRYVDWKWILFL